VSAADDAKDTDDMTGPVELHHHQQGPTDGPAVLLGPSLGTRLAMWDGLAGELSDRYRVIRYDTRGHGRSPVTPGPYDAGTLTEDVVALANSLGLDRFAVVGLSLGGAIGQTVAVRCPERVSSLVLCCTGPTFGDPAPWHERAQRVRTEGMGWLREPTKERWFTRRLLESHPDRCAQLLDMLTDTTPEGYASCCEALATFDMSGRLGEITAPTRVIAGAEDPVISPEVAAALADGIPDADLVVLDDASHIANADRPDAFNTAVREHLERTL
jgi:3-oxoadipate enol-lactonase